MREWHALLNGWKKWIRRLRPREVKWGDTVLAWASTGAQKVRNSQLLTFHSTSSIFFSNFLANCKGQSFLQIAKATSSSKYTVTANFSSILGENLSSFLVPLVLSIMATWGWQIWIHLLFCWRTRSLGEWKSFKSFPEPPEIHAHEWVCLLSLEKCL